MDHKCRAFLHKTIYFSLLSPRCMLCRTLALLCRTNRCIDTNSYPLTHRAAADKRTADKSDHWWHLFSLSASFFRRDTKAHISSNAETPPSLPWSDVLKCTFHIHRENAGQYQSQKTDKPSNKDSIFNVWSHTENDRSQRQRVTRQRQTQLNPPYYYS